MCLHPSHGRVRGGFPFQREGQPRSTLDCGSQHGDENEVQDTQQEEQVGQKDGKKENVVEGDGIEQLKPDQAWFEAEELQSELAKHIVVSAHPPRALPQPGLQRLGSCSQVTA